MNETRSESTCPMCRGPLAHGALEGVCPACAWLGLELGERAEGGADEGTFAIGGHEVLEEIGRGGGGIVYRVVQAEPRREVALKILRSHEAVRPEMRARFRAEAETIAALDHAGILPVYLVGEHDGLPFYTMKLATGGSLVSRRESWTRSWREIAGVIAQVADAVQFAHERGVIHRDLKPGNIVFDETGRPYVADFGMARLVAAAGAAMAVTQPAAVLGTPAYMAPEVAERGAAAATVAADVYGLGAVLYEMLAGRPPFSADSLVVLLKEIAVRPPERPSAMDPAVPRDLEVICLRCLAKEPSGRFSSAGELAADLRRWLEGRPITARPVPTMERAWFWARRNPALALLSLALVLGLVVGAVAQTVSFHRLQRAETDARVQLRAALVSEGRLLLRSGESGQRYDALDVLERAAGIRHGLDVRSAVAAALARPDVRLVASRPADYATEGTITAFTADLEHVAEADAGGSLMIRTTRDGTLVRRLERADGVPAHEMSFDASGRRLRVLRRDGRNEVWDLTSGAQVWESGQGEVALHPRDGDVLAYGDLRGGAWVRDVRSGAERALPEGGVVSALAFDGSGERLAVVRDARVEILDVGTLGRRVQVEAACSGIPPEWSPDGRLLAVGGADASSALVLELATGRVVQSLRGHSAQVLRMQFHPDSRRVWTMAGDNTVRLWDALSGAELVRVHAGRRALGISRDGRLLGASTTPRDIALFEIAPARVLREFAGTRLSGDYAINIALSPDGRWLASCDRSEIRLWSIEAGREVAVFPFIESDWPRVHFAPMGDALVYSGRSQGIFRRSFTAAADGPGVVLGEPKRVGEARDGLLLGFARGGRDWLIERETLGRVVTWPEGSDADERAVATSGRYERPEHSADGRWVVTMGYPRANTRLWRADTAALIGPVPVPHHAGAAFSPDGAWLLTNTRDEFRLWSVPGLAPGPGWPAENTGGAAWGAAAFSPDGAMIACEQGPGRIVLRRAADGEELITLEPALPQGIQHLVWAPDGRRLFLFFDQHRVFCWEIAALRQELEARGMGW